MAPERQQPVGNFIKCAEPSTCTVADFYNPWSFHKLLLQKPRKVIKWLQKEALITKHQVCDVCGRNCKLQKHKGRHHHGYRWRCRQKTGEKHEREYALTRNSFFRKSKFQFQDILQFIRNLLLQNTLRTNAIQSGFDYKRTAVDWANYVRDLFKKYVDQVYNEDQPMRLSGEVQVDESLFGRRCKHHRGNPNVGIKVWIVGLVEKSSNRLILYPVDDRTEETLLHIIERHVEPGSTIYTDGWAGYASLNSKGFNHFSVVHKEAFKAVYQNPTTGERVEVCTNRIEGAWKHCKDHFKKINGTSIHNFEAHLAEVIWRNHHTRQNIFQAFFNLMRRCYPLTAPPELETRSPLFDTWSVTDAESSLTRMSDDDNDDNDNDEGGNASNSASPPPSPPVPIESSTPRAKRQRSTSSSSTSSKRRCCPEGFKPSPPAQNARPRCKNPYTKDAFCTLSSDSDFE